MSRNRADIIKDTVVDAVGDLLYYDRKSDEELPREAIQEAIANGEITIDEIVSTFRQEFLQRM